jgi:ABC-2 type transport system permease protein
MITLAGTLQIFKKEIKTYFISPIAYIVIGIFVIISAFFFFFFNAFFAYNQASMRYFFSMLPIVFFFVVPAITMHLFSEEVSTGSYEMLLTMPLGFVDIIVGKFFAALALIAICLLPTVSFGIFISLLGNLDWGPVLGGYAGALFLGAAYTAIGLLASSLTKNQIIAFLCGCFFCFVLWLLDKVPYIMPPSFGLGYFFQYLGVNYHFDNISRGILDTRDFVYFISVCFIALFSTKIVMEEKK